MRSLHAFSFALLVSSVAAGCRDEPDCCPMHEDEANFCGESYETGVRSLDGRCRSSNVWGSPRAGYAVYYASDGCPYWGGPGDPSTGICPYPFADSGPDLDTAFDSEVDAPLEVTEDVPVELDVEPSDADVPDAHGDLDADAAADGSAGVGDAEDVLDADAAGDGSSSSVDAANDADTTDGSGAGATDQGGTP